MCAGILTSRPSIGYLHILQMALLAMKICNTTPAIFLLISIYFASFYQDRWYDSSKKSYSLRVALFVANCQFVKMLVLSATGNKNKKKLRQRSLNLVCLRLYIPGYDITSIFTSKVWACSVGIYNLEIGDILGQK